MAILPGPTMNCGRLEALILCMLVPAALARRLRSSGSQIASTNLSVTVNTLGSNQKHLPSAWNNAFTVFKVAGEGTYGQVSLARLDSEPGINVAVKYSKTPDAQTAVVAKIEVAMMHRVAHRPYFMGFWDVLDMTTSASHVGNAENIQFWSLTNKQWIDGAIKRVHKNAVSGKVEHYDLILHHVRNGQEKPMVLPSHVRKATDEQLIKVEDLVRFWSNTYQRFFLARVQKLYLDGSGKKRSADIYAVDGTDLRKSNVPLHFLLPVQGQNGQRQSHEQYMLILMEAANGIDGAIDLTAAMRSFPKQHLLMLAMDAIKGVVYLHSKNILHRDLKPDNILLSRARGKVADLGTACDLAVAHGDLSCRNLAGTPNYLAPEIWQSQGFSKTADVWAIGLILWEIIFGILPRQIRMSTSFADVGTNVKLFNSPPGKLFEDPAWRGAAFQDPDRIKGIMYWALHPDPTQRIGADTLLYALEDFVQVEYGRLNPRKTIPYSPPRSASHLVKFQGCEQVADDQDLFVSAARPVQPRVALPPSFQSGLERQASRPSQTGAMPARISQQHPRVPVQSGARGFLGPPKWIW